MYQKIIELEFNWVDIAGLIAYFDRLITFLLVQISISTIMSLEIGQLIYALMTVVKL
jgi:hypothetical protein